MKTNNEVKELIRELICLGFFSRCNFNHHKIFLGEYQHNDKIYEIHWSFIDEQEISIFIKCGDNSIQLIIEETRSNRPAYTSEPKDVYLHINKYKNVDFDDVSYLWYLKDVNRESIVYKSKIQLDYQRMDYMVNNPNRIGLEYETERYRFVHPEILDKAWENKKYIEVFKNEFSPEIILNIINQIYPNVKQIDINNKIDRVINSLSQEELLILREKLHKKTSKTLQSVSEYYYNQEQKDIENAIQTLKRIKPKQDM